MAEFKIEARGKPRIYEVQRRMFGIWNYKTQKDLPGFSGKIDKRYKKDVNISVSEK